MVLTRMRWVAAAGVALLVTGLAQAAHADTIVCGDPANPTDPKLLPKQSGSAPASPSALVIKGLCQVQASASPYYYSTVNVIGSGTLQFVDPGSSAADKTTVLWASSIIVENQASLLAGTPAAPYGAAAAGSTGAVLTITLYGADQTNRMPNLNTGMGALCFTNVVDPKPPAGSPSPVVPCGIPTTAWDSNGDGIQSLPGGVNDLFYTYAYTYGDGAASKTSNPPGQIGFFGDKVLGVGYGATLGLYGAKGATGGAAADADPTQSGTSWVRLNADLPVGATTMTLSHSVAGDWKQGDQVVVTTTDYLPSHSERVTLVEDPSTTDPSGTKVKFTPATAWHHQGTRFNLSRLNTGPGGRLTKAFLDPDTIQAGAETRAAVGLLTRSIQIVSGGDTAGQSFDDAEKASGSNHYYYGAHTIYRQGFQQVQIQGVEFRQMGSGGVLGHYPVHFHMARLTPANTFVKDSSVNESMTRWMVLHDTLGVTLARNVGYLSIGHGFYFEDGTETDNKLHSNLGIYARAAVVGPDNPHNVPGILDDNTDAGLNIVGFPKHTDVANPSAFWIMNGWNDFIGNMAAGTGSCGACFWLVPGANSDMQEVHAKGTMPAMTWSGVPGISGNSAIQANSRYGTSPLKSFYKNYCASSNSAFTTVDGASCGGVAGAKAGNVPGYLHAVQSPTLDPMLLPKLAAQRRPTVCDPNATTGPTSCAQFNQDASQLTECDNTNPTTCALTLLDHFTTSFNWPQTNFAAVWLRGAWNMLDNSFISDVQNGGVTVVSGGDYTRSSVPEGYWGLVSRTVMVGETQPTNPYAYDRGPFNNDTLKLDPAFKCVRLGPACTNVAYSVAYPLTNWMGQRLFSIYDGPSYEDSNAFLDIRAAPCASLLDCMYYENLGVRSYPAPNSPTRPAAFLPNAAIAWKQPNGFYYPPAFHSTNLFFSNVDIRHFLIEPYFIPTTYRSDPVGTAANFAGISQHYTGAFNGYTDIDRQTELNDDDGSLTGLSTTISVSEDKLFTAPTETSECLSNLDITPTNVCANKKPTAPSARTSPYDYVTTVLYPDCASKAQPGSPPGIPPPNPSYFDRACDSEVFHTTVPGKANHVLTDNGRGGTWSKDCAGPYCFGVPIYRQYLQGTPGASPTGEWVQWQADGCDKNPDPSGLPYVDAPATATAVNIGNARCQYPFARMNAAATFSRSAMTANNGLFYIDATIPLSVQADSIFASTGAAGTGQQVYINCSVLPTPNIDQCQPLSVNAFSPGQTYYLFLLFGKDTTKQAYQIYVGPDFKIATDFKQVAMSVNTAQVVPKTLPTPDPSYTTATMIAGPNDDPGKPGLLQVTIDFSKIASKVDPTLQSSGLCRPSGFCGWTGANTCGCTLAKNDPRLLANPKLQAICNSICQSAPKNSPLPTGGWATKDLDCPADGCRGFSFTLPASFAPGKYDRPAVQPYPAADGWNVPFKATTTAPDNTPSGTCHYANLPGTPACPSGN